MKTFKEYPYALLIKYKYPIAKNAGGLWIRMKDNKYSLRYIKGTNKWYNSAYFDNNPNNWISYEILLEDVSHNNYEHIEEDTFEQFIFLEIY